MANVITKQKVQDAIGNLNIPLSDLVEQYPNFKELRKVLAGMLPPLKGEDMVNMLIAFDVLDSDGISAPDSDFVEALAYDVRTEPEEVDRFWKYLAMGDLDGEWED